MHIAHTHIAYHSFHLLVCSFVCLFAQPYFISLARLSIKSAKLTANVDRDKGTHTCRMPIEKKEKKLKCLSIYRALPANIVAVIALNGACVTVQK